MNRKRILFGATTLLLVAACAAGPKIVEEGDPWQVDKDDFLRYAKTIGLADVYLPGGMQDPEPIKQNFSDVIETELRRMEYTVVRPQQYKTNWDRIVAELGGIEDTLAIGQNPRKIAQAMARTLEELEAGFDLDAVLIPSVVVVEAQFASGVAAWDGTRQPIKTGGAIKNFWAGSPEGTLGALSLRVTLVSPHGNTYYTKSGGIEVLSKLEGKEFVLVPRAELFTNQERIEESVAIALKPLAE
jgi:hypothetical protein